MTKLQNVGDIINYISKKIFEEISPTISQEEFKITYDLILREMLAKKLIDFNFLDFDLASLNSIKDLAKFKIQIQDKMDELGIPEKEFDFYYIDAILLPVIYCSFVI